MPGIMNVNYTTAGENPEKRPAVEMATRTARNRGTLRASEVETSRSPFER